MFTFESVTQLNNYTNELLSNDPGTSSLSVTGEISNLTIYRTSGHAYFTLKDDASQVSCVMFKSYLAGLNFVPKDGMKVVLTGSCAIYSASGRFQIKAFAMAQKGKGDLAEQMKQLHRKLSAEGLFAQEHKLPIPVLPERIGVISSPAGAVIHDIINTLNRRNPYYSLLLYPAAVQGEACSREVISGIEYLSSRDDIDVIIIARGGGSLEDLWGFNDEALARKIYDCRIPIISAVGHETDYTICDYVADLRAPTPTAAAELVISRYDELLTDLAHKKSMLNLALMNYAELQRRRLDALKDSKALYSPMVYVETLRASLENVKKDLDNSGKMLITEQRHKLKSIIDGIELLGPMNVLKRGYSYASKDKRAVTEVKGLKVGDDLDVIFSDGYVNVEVKDIYEGDGKVG